jgi:PQQ-dependent dehydrogenase (methanol/ethanol family)
MNSKRIACGCALAAAASWGIVAFGANAAASTDPVARTAAFPTSSWPTTGGNLANARYSALTQINAKNVGRLSPAWSTVINPGFKTGPLESPPIVVGPTMFVSSSRGAPAALNAATGHEYWVTDPTTQSSNAGRGSAQTGNGRGEAYGDGMIFEGQGDGTITAFNATTGAVVWKTLINTAHVSTYAPATPVFYNGIVYTSLSGNEFGQLRGAVYAYNAKTGTLLWTWYVVPFAGQPGSKTWGSPSELATGGGGNWTYGAIDPKLGLLYETTGNPSPDFGRGKGSDLYTDSVVALTLKTGKMKWYFQTTHHDEWDYDCASPPVLWNHEISGTMVHGLDVGCKNGYVYELNRLNGKPVTPVKNEAPPNTKTVGAATLKEDSTWSKTQPIPVGSNVVPHCVKPSMVPGPASDGTPYEYSCTFAYVGQYHWTVSTPGINGAINYEPSSLDPKVGYMYVCAQVVLQPTKVVPGAPSPLGAIAPTFSNESFPPSGYVAPPGTKQLLGTLTAVNLNNNRNVWQKRYYTTNNGSPTNGTQCKSGSTATASGLVFMAEGESFYAYSAATGKQLWSYTPPAGVIVNSAPAIYAVNGKEYVAWDADVGVNPGQTAQDEVLAFAVGG